MTNRQMAALETRKRLVDAAKGIISEKGLANTSINEITDACGVSKGTFYTYFKRKEDIVYELSGGKHRDIMLDAQAKSDSLHGQITYFLVEMARFIEKNSLKLCQEWVRNTVDPDLIVDSTQKHVIEGDIHLVEELLEDAKKRGELAEDCSVHVLAHTLIDILYGQMLCWDMSGGAYSFRERTEEFCDRYLQEILRIH